MQIQNGYKQTSIGEIPEEWKIKKLEELADLQAGGTPSRFKNEYWENGTIPWLSSGEVRNNIVNSSSEKITELGLSKSAARLFSKGTVLIAITGQGLTRGRTALLGIDCTTNQSIVGIMPNESLINNVFLWYYLQNQYWKLRNISQGSNQAGLNLELLNSYSISVPALPEQEKIASILSKLDELIQETDHVIEQTQRLKIGLMQRLLTRGIGHTTFKRTEQGEIPQDWEIKDLTEFSVTYRYPTFYDIEYCSDGIAVLNIGNIDNHTWKLSTNHKDYQKIDKKTSHLFSKTIVEEGDLVLAVRGATIGKFALVPNVLSSSNINANLLRIHLNKEICDPIYFWYYTQTQHGRSEFKKFVSYTAKETVQAGRLKFWKIILPKIDEQRKIRSILDCIDSKIENGRQYKVLARNLKKGLMQKLLTGKIRVKV